MESLSGLDFRELSGNADLKCRSAYLFIVHAGGGETTNAAKDLLKNRVERTPKKLPRHGFDGKPGAFIVSLFSVHHFVGKDLDPVFLSGPNVVREAQGAILGSGDYHHFHSLIQGGTVSVFSSILSTGSLPRSIVYFSNLHFFRP
jgi:hypothetical protein